MIWTTHRGSPTTTSKCGRASVTKIGSRYEVTVDGDLLAYGVRVRKPYRYPTASEAKAAAEQMLATGVFSPPTRRDVKYPTYDPSVEGFGSPAQWQAIFESAVGTGALPSSEELAESLGLPQTTDWDEIKKAYRKKILKLHPDQGGDARAFQAAVEAMQALEARRRVSSATSPSQG
jgi:hypothetical protein